MSNGLLSVPKSFGGLVAGLLCVTFGWQVQPQTVDAQFGFQEQEGVRVAALEASLPAPAAAFSRPAAQPWPTLGQHNGYFSIRVADAVKHPLLKHRLAMVYELLEGALRAEDDGIPPALSEFGFSLDKISSLEASAHLALDSIPEEERNENGATRKLGFGINGSDNGFAIHADAEIDWPGLLDAVDFGKFMDQESASLLQAAMVKSSSPGRQLTFISTPATEGNGLCLEPTSRQKQMWTDVSGGVLTVFTNLNAPHFEPLENPVSETDSPVAARVFEETWNQISSIAIGADFSPGNDSEKLRISLEPRSGLSASQLAEQLKKLRQALIDTLGIGSTEGMTDQYRELIIQQLRDARIVVVGTENGSYVLVTGQMSIAKMIEAQ